MIRAIDTQNVNKSLDEAFIVRNQARAWERNPDTAPAPDFNLLPYVKRVEYSSLSFDKKLGTARETAVTLWDHETGHTGEKPFKNGDYSVTFLYGGIERRVGLYDGYYKEWMPNFLIGALIEGPLEREFRSHREKGC